MPIFYTQEINAHTKLGIWKIEEDEAFFLQKVPVPQGVTHPFKRLQHIAGRYLLQYLFPRFPYNEIVIADTRKPYLPQAQFHFSVSHSGHFAAAIVSQTQRAGIDIELYSSKTEWVKNKFLTAAELILVNSQPSTVNQQPSTVNYQPPIANHQLFTLAWCCKEAVYKYWGAGGIDFKKHICIQNIDTIKQDIAVAFTKNNSQLTIHYSLFEALCLAWTTSR